MSTVIRKSKMNLAKIKIKNVVTENFHTAELFEKYGIDYCCGGDRFLGQVLEEKKISSSAFLKELSELHHSDLSKDRNYSEWDLDRLAMHIIDTHHTYVKNAIPQIKAHLQKVFNAHSKKHPFIKDVQNIFSEVADELTGHMMKEERILFPIIKYLAESDKIHDKPKTRGYGTVQNPIRQMEAEHVSAGGALERIRTLTDNYSLPGDACTTFEITYKELEEFEKDLHIHVHLENNILFPRSIELENRLVNEIIECRKEV